MSHPVEYPYCFLGKETLDRDIYEFFKNRKVELGEIKYVETSIPFSYWYFDIKNEADILKTKNGKILGKISYCIRRDSFDKEILHEIADDYFMIDFLGQEKEDDEIKVLRRCAFNRKTNKEAYDYFVKVFFLVTKQKEIINSINEVVADKKTFTVEKNLGKRKYHLKKKKTEIKSIEA